MNAKQSNKLASYTAVQAVFEAHPDVANAAGLPAKLAVFSAKVGELDRLAQTQTQPTAGRTARRDELLNDMVDTALEIAGVVSTVAQEHKLTQMAEDVPVSRNAFLRVRRSHRPWLAERVLEAAQSVVPELGLYGVSEETLQALQAQINAARDGLKQPRAMILTKKAASAELAVLFAEIDTLLGRQIDRLVFPLRKTHREFYVAYRGARSVVDRPGSSRAATAAGEGEATTPVATPGATSSPSTPEKIAA